MSDKREFAISREFIFAHKNFQIYSKQRIHIMQRLYEESKPARAATIQLPHDTIRITIFASRYDTYRDTFLATLEP